MKRILVPVDFSPTSKKAFGLAVDMASRFGSHILLYHLYSPEKKHTIGVYHDVKAINQKKESDLVKRLLRLKKRVVGDRTNVTVSAIVGRTPVVKNILKFADENQIDLIIMGTQGASGLKKIIVGSVAGKVMEKSDIPVLLVPEKYELNSIRHMAFTTNFENADRTAFHLIFNIARHYDALVTLVNLEDPYARNKNVEKKIERLGYFLQKEFNDAKMQFRQLKTTSVEQTMENLHEEISYDLLAMARRKLGLTGRLFQKSFTKKMGYVTTYPLLIIPE